MKQVAWDKKYETGVEDIDLQHHYFLNLVNRLVAELEKGQDPEYIEALVSELNAYARFHFTSEERMMIHSNYPYYEVHKNHHLDLLQSLGVKEFKLIHTSTKEEAEEMIRFLINWFIDHTTGEDKDFANYLLKNEQSN